MKSIAGLILILAASPVAAQQGERLFYYSDNERSYASLVANIDHIDVLAPSA